MKNLFTILESEKQRILNMHIDATKRNYLTEQASKTTTWTSGVLDANFDAGKYEIPTLKPQQKDKIDTSLKNLVNWAKNPQLIDKQIIITIEASTSTSGSYGTNERLTNQRYTSGQKYVDTYLKTNLPENTYKNITYKSKLEIEKGEGPDFQYFKIDANATAKTKAQETPKGRKLFWEVNQPVVTNVNRIKYCPARGENWMITNNCPNGGRDAFYVNSFGRWLFACNPDDEIMKSPLLKDCLSHEGKYNEAKEGPKCRALLDGIPNFRDTFVNSRAVSEDDMNEINRFNAEKNKWCKVLNQRVKEKGL